MKKNLLQKVDYKSIRSESAEDHSELKSDSKRM